MPDPTTPRPTRAARRAPGLSPRFSLGLASGLAALAIVASTLPAAAQQAYFRGQAEPDENVIVNLSVIDKLTGGAPSMQAPTLTRPAPAPAPAPAQIPPSSVTDDATAGAAGDGGLAPPPSGAPQSTLLVEPNATTGAPTPTPVPVPASPQVEPPKPAPPPPKPTIAEEPEPQQETAAAPQPAPASKPAPAPAPEPEVAAEPAPAPAPPPPAPEPAQAAEEEQTASVDLTALSEAGILELDNGLSVLFTTDSQDLPPQAEDPLRTLAQRMESDETLTLKLLGYSEPIGEAQSKPRRLSLFRALAVRTFLLKEGIDSRRMTVQALGAKTDDAPDRPMNRVDLIVSQG